jgi:hypothetical protein
MQLQDRPFYAPYSPEDFMAELESMGRASTSVKDNCWCGNTNCTCRCRDSGVGRKAVGPAHCDVTRRA